jgi:hypothetical protein
MARTEGCTRQILERATMFKLKITLLVMLCLPIIAPRLAATDELLRGLVSDALGKPVRGAIVKATTGQTSTSRYTQANGRFEISVPSGTYSVTVDAYAFSRKQQTVNVSHATEINFTLSPQWDVSTLTGADVEPMLPDNTEMRFLSPPVSRATVSTRFTEEGGVQPRNGARFVQP